MQDAENSKLDQNAKEEVEVVEPKKPNRHERRRRAKLEKMLTTNERLEKLGRKK